MEVGLVHKINIDDEMQQSYLDYAMSVIVARALPDARDGLKPVHRRILYAMYDMGLRPETPYKKSARIVGEVLGKYHPHGDMAVYEAMARMAQDFSMRYRLVDGQGNFGSVDGDAPAAMRYTEAKLAAPAINLLGDIQKNTVDFNANFDSTLTEPSVLPAAIPNLLINGATGIAVGMATSIPPHNLVEVVDAIHYMLEKWDRMDDISVEDLMRFVKGPDFPTGGIILQEASGDGLISAYSTGRGRVTLQASAHIEEMERGRSRIIVSELPYMTNKSSLIERIASLVREEKLEGISDLRDESDRQGMRIVIELTKNADPQKVLSALYRSTPMQSTFSIIMLALVEGEPRMLSLKQCLRVYVEHRLEIIRRRSEYDLSRARQRAHILEGLRTALNNLDEVISMIRKSPDADTARIRLIKRFKLSEIQAQAILDMPLRRLAALERKKIEEEYKEVRALISELESLLRSPKKMRQVVDQDLQTVKEAYGDRRRTHIFQMKAGELKVELLTTTDLKPEKIIWLSVTSEGLISRSQDDKPPRLSGREAPRWLIQANTRDTLYLVSEKGEAAAIPVHAIPDTEQNQTGLPLDKVSALKDGQPLAGLFTLPYRDRRADANRRDSSFEINEKILQDSFILTVTQQGMVKKSTINDLPGPSASSFTLVRVNEGDRLRWLRLTNNQNEILLVTANGIAIRFHEEEIRPMGLVAAGVQGIKLQSGDEIAGLDLLPQAGEVFLLASDGSAKRVQVDQFPRQGRYGQGIIAWKLPSKIHVVGMAVGKGTRRAIVHLARLAPRPIRLDEAPIMGRAARSQVVKEISGGDRVVGLCIPWEMERQLVAQTGDEGSTVKKVRSRQKAEPTQLSLELDASSKSPKPTSKSSVAPAKKTAAHEQPAQRTTHSPSKRSPQSGQKTPAATKPAPKPTARKKTPSGSSLNSSKPAAAKKTKTEG
jgi:DNA gyrase subunit A